MTGALWRNNRAGVKDMFEKRLIERILTGSSGTRLTIDASAVLNDVLSHLSELFNTRQGSVMIRRDYGMIDINDVIHRFPDAVAELRTEIKRQIDTFEPRLREVSVQHVPMPDRPLSLVFNVTATLDLGTRTERVTVETELGDDGLMRVLG
jgi:type VI secretion system protein